MKREGTQPTGPRQGYIESRIRVLGISPCPGVGSQSLTGLMAHYPFPSMALSR